MKRSVAGKSVTHMRVETSWKVLFWEREDILNKESKWCGLLVLTPHNLVL